MQQANAKLHSSNSRQQKKLDELFCCVYQIFENGDMFAKDFIQHRYYRSMFTPLYSLVSLIGNFYKTSYA